MRVLTATENVSTKQKSQCRKNTIIKLKTSTEGVNERQAHVKDGISKRKDSAVEFDRRRRKQGRKSEDRLMNKRQNLAGQYARYTASEDDGVKGRKLI